MNAPLTTTLFRGGRIAGSQRPHATSLMVEQDTIAWVGDETDAAARAEGATQTVQLDGGLLTPSFVDAHVHTTSTGLLLTGLDLADCPDLHSALDRIEQHCRDARGGVVLGQGWDETTWPENRPPTRQELDRASYGGVVYLSRVDVHSCVASSALLAVVADVQQLSGFADDGWLKQDAHHAVRKVAFESLTTQQRRAAQRAALSHAASLGIGMVHEIGGPQISGADDFIDLLTVVGAEPGPEIVGYWGESGGPSAAVKVGAVGAAGDLFVDGAIGSRTALLANSYSDAETNGAQYLTAAEIRDHVVACSRAGVQAGYHVIGDAAMELVAAGFTEAAARVSAEVVRSARHRLEHVEMVNEEQISLFANLGIVASVQPVFDELWGGEEGMYVTRLGRERARRLNPYASMLRAGMTLALGSDAPVTPLGPWSAVRAAVHHHVEEHRISVASAFRAHTRGGWQAAGRSDGGGLNAGEPANLAVWDAGDLSTDNLPTLHPGSLLPRCLRTVVRGSTVYDGASQ